jgi:hypothetical protein
MPRGTSAVTTTYSYDSNGNQDSRIAAPLSRRYQAMPTMRSTAWTKSPILQQRESRYFAYDAEDNDLTSVTGSAGVSPRATPMTASGNVTQQTSPDTGTSYEHLLIRGGNLQCQRPMRALTSAHYTYDALITA